MIQEVRAVSPGPSSTALGLRRKTKRLLLGILQVEEPSERACGPSSILYQNTSGSI
jgi:hypothetical protein